MLPLRQNSRGRSTASARNSAGHDLSKIRNNTHSESPKNKKSPPRLKGWGFFRSVFGRALAVRQNWLLGRRLSGFEGGEALVDLVPIYDVPPGRKIFGTAVVVF